MPARRAAVLRIISLLCGLLLEPPAALPAQGGAPPRAVTVRAVAARDHVRPGDQTVIAVELRHAPGFHTWPHEPVIPKEFAGVMPIATTIDITSSPAGTEPLAIQWPAPESVTVYYGAAPVALPSYVGNAVAYVPFRLADSLAPGRIEIGLRVRYQACDPRICYFPVTAALTVPLVVVPAGTPVQARLGDPALFAKFDLTTFGGAGALRPPPVTLSAFRWSLTIDPEGAGGMLLLLLLAAAGGLALNVTPCVLPLIPIKILGLRSAAGTLGRLRLLGVAMTAGVIGFWVALGAAIAFVSGFTAISSLFQTGWFAPLVGAVVAVMAIGMSGWFTVRLPQAIYRLNPRQDTIPGSLGFGVLTAVLSTPCTAPFMAGAAAWAATRAPATTLATFGAIGAGMSLPYFLLTLRPGLLARVPRGGAAGVAVKQVMALLMLAVAAFFLGSGISAWLQRPPQPVSRAWWWIVAGFVALAFTWLVRQTWRLTTARRPRAIATAVGAAGVLAAAWLGRGLASRGPIDWVYYTPAGFSSAVARGQVVVMEFTAEWCLNCKALEAAALNRREVAALLASPGVTPMRVDLTSDNPPGRAKLAELGWVGIPLLAVFGPGLNGGPPITYDSYTPGMVIDAVRRARPPARPGSVP